MARNLYGWDYPPGAEHDPRAPYNQDPNEVDIETVEEALQTSRHLEELLESIDDANNCLPNIRHIIEILGELKLED